jgi:hypothetical protein
MSTAPAVAAAPVDSDTLPLPVLEPPVEITIFPLLPAPTASEVVAEIAPVATAFAAPDCIEIVLAEMSRVPPICSASPP